MKDLLFLRRLNTLFTLIFFLQILSCQKYSEKELYIIDSLKLGSTKENYEVDLMKYKLIKRPFYTHNCIIKDLDNSILVNSTSTFDFDSNDFSKHFGLLFPDYGNYNKNLIGMLVLLGHTEKTYSCEDYSTLSEGTDIDTFEGSIRKDYIDQMESALIKKYGKPIRTKKYGVFYYAFVGKKIQTFMTSKNENGELLEWNNNKVRILFFKGIPDEGNFYSALDNIYKHAFQLNDISEYESEFKRGAIFTYRHPFISYYLKEDYIKKQNLDNLNL